MTRLPTVLTSSISTVSVWQSRRSASGCPYAKRCVSETVNVFSYTDTGICKQSVSVRVNTAPPSLSIRFVSASSVSR